MDPREELEKQALARLDKPEPSNRDLADNLKVIINHLWSKDDLRDFVTKVIINRLWSKDDLRDFVTKEHRALCANCTKSKPGLSLWDKWMMGLVGTLITALCGALCYFTKGAN